MHGKKGGKATVQQKSRIEDKAACLQLTQNTSFKLVSGSISKSAISDVCFSHEMPLNASILVSLCHAPPYHVDDIGLQISSPGQVYCSDHCSDELLARPAAFA